jgi:hypothetical protein
MNVSHTKNLHALGDENKKLTRVLADAMLDNAALMDLERN